MEVTTLPGWYCVCGTFNKPAWHICPTCETRRDSIFADSTESPLPPPPSSSPYQPPGSMPNAPARGDSSFVAKTVVTLFVGLVVLGIAWAAFGALDLQLPDGLSSADRARQKTLNTRTPPPASQRAAYDALGRRVVAPAPPFKPADDEAGVRSGPVTPAQLSALSDGASTPEEVAASGFQRGWIATWSSPKENRLVLTWMYEFKDASGIPERARDHSRGSLERHGVETVTVPMKAPGVYSARTTKKTSSGFYYTIATTHGRNRMTSVFLATEDAPREADIEWLRQHVRKQQAALKR